MRMGSPRSPPSRCPHCRPGWQGTMWSHGAHRSRDVNASARSGSWVSSGSRRTRGLSVFLHDGDDVFHTYSTYQRGLDLLLNIYNYLDLTPLGRREDDEPAQSWISHRVR